MKKMMIIAAMAMFVALGAQAQTDKGEKQEKTYDIVEVMPVFPGGPQAMFKFIGANVKYPEADKKADVTGRVVVQFTIAADGSVKDAKVVRHGTEAMDKEALRVVALMPKWIPGMKKGKAVNVKYTMPISFGSSFQKAKME